MLSIKLTLAAVKTGGLHQRFARHDFRCLHHSRSCSACAQETCRREDHLIISHLAPWKSFTSNLSTVPVRKAASHHGKARRIGGLLSNESSAHTATMWSRAHDKHDCWRSLVVRNLRARIDDEVAPELLGARSSLHARGESLASKHQAPRVLDSRP